MDFTLRKDDLFPSGTVVDVYVVHGSYGADVPTAPPGSPATSVTTNGSGSTTISGLTQDTPYVALSRVAPTKRTFFRTDQTQTTLGDETAARQAADAAEAALRLAGDDLSATDLDLAGEVAIRAAADSTEASTRAAADTALSAAVALKQDASTAATDAEVSALFARRWINVKDPAYGAVGDGTADDTTAVAAAITAAAQTGSNRGGTVYFPKGIYKITSLLNCDDTQSVVLQGEGSCAADSATILRYTASTGGLLRARGSQGFTVKGMRLEYTHASFAGYLVEFGQTAGLNATYANFKDVWMQGVGVSGALALVRARGLIEATFDTCVFQYAQRAVIGNDGQDSIAISFVGRCLFNNIVLAPIYQPHQAWKFDGAIFEPLQSGAAGALAHDSTVVCLGLELANCWFGDTTTDSGSWVSVYAFGLDIHGCYIDLTGKTVAKTIALYKCEGASIRGNHMAGGGTNVDIAGGWCFGLELTGNRMTGTTKLSNPGQVNPSLIRGNHTGESTSVASAATLPALPFSAKLVTVTGTTNITSGIPGTWPEREVVLIFAGVLTLTDGANLKLNGNYVTTADDTLSLIYDGTNWIETARSAN